MGADAVTGDTVELDARPTQKTAKKTYWDDAIALRDRFAAKMRAVLAQEKIDAAVIVSAAGIYPPWASLEAWLPRDSGRERNQLEIVVTAKPFHRHRLLTTVSVRKGGRTDKFADQADYSDNDVEKWTRWVIGRGRRPLAVLLDMRPLPAINYVRKEFRSGFLRYLPGLAAVALILVGAYLFVSDFGLVALVPVLAGLGWLVAIATKAAKRKVAIHVPAQPETQPRATVLVDSWHAVVAELGSDFDPVKRRLLDCASQDCEEFGVTCQSEAYSYRTPVGFEERDRLVVSKGQAQVHVHVYRFGDDIFVGWDALLNWRKWIELAATSVKVSRGLRTEFRELHPGYYVPNQFDLIDLDSLSDLVHRRLEREIKAILDEKAIDQEIDFRIIRGDRDQALDQAKHGGKDREKPGWGSAKS